MKDLEPVINPSQTSSSEQTNVSPKPQQAASKQVAQPEPYAAVMNEGEVIVDEQGNIVVADAVQAFVDNETNNDKKEDIEKEVTQEVEEQAEAMTSKAPSDGEQVAETPEVAEVIESDVVAQTEDAIIEDMEEESSFFANNWLWLGALAGGAVALAQSDSKKPVPEPTISISDSQVDASEATFMITGTADRNANVAVTVGGLTKNVTSSEDGSYSVSFTAQDIEQVGQGNVTVTVTSNVNEGRVSETTSAAMTIDTVRPDAPTIANVTADNIVNKSEQTTVITGTAEADSTLTLSIGGDSKVITVSPEGTWSYTLTAADIIAMGEGEETLSLTVTDAIGNISDATTLNITVDTTDPAAPVFNTLAGDNIINAAEVTSAITGTTEANATVTLTLPTGDVNVVADATGTWSHSLTAADVTAMGEGAESISAIVTDVAGNTSTAGTLAISVDTLTPTIQGMSVDASTNSVTLTYSDTLDASNVALADSFVITAGNSANLVSNVTVTGNQVVLSLTDNFVSGQAVTINYTDASGDQVNALQDVAGNDVLSFEAGVVADGFVKGAQIYLDANENGIADEGEALSGIITDANGNFIMPDGINPNGYSIIAMGGVNVDTGALNTVALKAPANATSINPITTLIQTAVENNLADDVDAASALVKTALGISSDTIDLLNYDPLSAIAGGGADAAEALNIQKSAVQVVAVLVQANEGKGAAEAAGDANTILTNIMSSASEGNTIDLTDTAFVTSALDSVTSNVEVTQMVESTTNISSAVSLAEVTVAQAVAIDSVAPDSPLSVVVTALTNDTTPTATVSFDTSSLKGGAAVVGDTITVMATLGDNVVEVSHVLTSTDIAAQEVTLTLPELAEGEHAVTANITDIASNTSTATTAANTLEVDITAPNVVVTTDQAVLNGTETATITLTFDENPGDTITVEDLSVSGGIISAVAGTGLVRTATVTPLADIDELGSVSVKADSYTDAAGNTGTSGSVEFAVDTTHPSVTITSDVDTLKAGETATITFTFTEAPAASFTNSDITVVGGSLGDISGDGLIYSATFTPSADLESNASITIEADSYSDPAGNTGKAGTTPSIAIDTLLPAITTAAFSSSENSTAVASLAASESATFVLGDGADTSLFSLTDGVLTFVEAPDFEAGQTSFTVNVVLTDAAGNTQNATLTITLNNVNEAPEGSAISSQTAVVGQAFSFDLADSFTDVDADDTLTLTIEGSLPDGLSFADGVISGTATADTAVANITVTATDTDGLSASQTLAINAVSAPVISAITLTQGDSSTAKAGEVLTLVATLSEAFTLTLNDATPTITLTMGGTDVIAQYVSHDADAKTINFSATAPTGDATSAVVKAIMLGDATLVGTTSLQPLTITTVGQSDSGFTLDNTAATLTVDSFTANENATAVGTITSSETATITLGSGADSALFSLTDDGVLSLNDAQNFEADDTSLTVNVDLVDAAGNTSTDSLTVNIADVNEAPEGTAITSQTAVVGQAFSVDLADSFTDVDADDTLTLTIEGSLPDGLSFADGVISGTATADTAVANITVTATDTDGLSASQTLAINAVSAPVISAITLTQGDSSTAKAGEVLTLVATLSEAFTLTLNDATPTITLTMGGTDVIAQYVSHDADAKTINFSATAPTGDASSAVLKAITLGAATIVGVTSAQPLTITTVGQSDTNFTLDNTPATLITDTLSAAENATAVGSIVTSESATVTLGEGADSDLFTLTDGVLTLKDAQDFETDETSLTVNFDLTDAAGNTSTDSVTVNVTNVNEAPVGVDIAAQTAVVAQAFSLDVTTSFSDVDANDTLTYSIVGDLPAGLTFADGVISGTATADTAEATVTVTATDAAGLTASETFTINAVSAPIISTELSNLGEKMLDVRSDIILQIDQAVSAVSGKTITFTDNTETGYQGETKTNSFTIAADSDLITIDNDKGVIIINVDANFDLDLSSNYTLSIDDGAFVSTLSGLASATIADITFNTVMPTSDADALSRLGSIDEVGSKTNFFNTKWLTDWKADTDTGNYSHTYLVKSGFNFIPVTDISNQDVIDSIGGDTEYYISFDGNSIDVVTLDFLMSVSDIEYEALSSADSAAYEIQISAAQGYMMNVDDGSLVESAQWVDIEGLGVGTTSGNVASLAADVASENVFKIDASSADYVFVFSDQNPAGGDSQVGAGLETNTDFSVFLDEFGAGDQVYVDDAFNDADNLNVLSYEVFASGNGSEGAELYLGLSGGDGDPRLYVGLEGDTESTDESGNADNSLEGVNGALGLDDDSSVVITA